MTTKPNLRLMAVASWVVLTFSVSTFARLYDGTLCGNKGKLKGYLLAGFLICLLISPAQGQYGPGNGTSSNPYQILEPHHMNAIGDNPSHWGKHFKLMNDIDLSGYTGSDFNIIGSGWDEPFTGVFNGNGYKIYNFSYGPVAPDSYVGIFGMVGKVGGASGEIKNLGLINPNIDVLAFMTGALAGRVVLGTITNCYIEGGSVLGDNSVGGLVGSSGFINAEIINCYTNTSVSGDWDVGGLCGYNGGTISNCYAIGNVVGNSNTGGLVGDNKENSLISNCYASGIIQGADDTGGLAGRNWGGTISNCYATGNVSGDDVTGGLVGKNSGANGYTATITNSYATGNVNGTGNFVGGLVASHAGFIDPAEITNCYSVGSVSGDTSIGGLIGGNFAGSVVDSFWDKTTSGQSSSDGGTGKITSEMQTESTFTSAGWDFVAETTNGTEDIWTIHDGNDYPKLVWPLVNFVGWYEVDLADYAFFANYWEFTNCGDANDCNGVDLDFSDAVDRKDLKILFDKWLTGLQ